MERGPVAQFLGESPASRYETVDGGREVARGGEGQPDDSIPEYSLGVPMGSV